MPAGIAPGEKRPAVVAQHGLEGVPAEVVEADPTTRAFGTYKAFAVRLVERGFVVFAPHNPYRGPDFRQLQRKAHPLGISLFSFITAQHERILDWLGGLPEVDPARIGIDRAQRFRCAIDDRPRRLVQFLYERRDFLAALGVAGPDDDVQGAFALADRRRHVE